MWLLVNAEAKYIAAADSVTSFVVFLVRHIFPFALYFFKGARGAFHERPHESELEAGTTEISLGKTKE